MDSFELTPYQIELARQAEEKPKRKKAKKAGTSPTQLTLKKWRKAGYMCAIVEKWNPHVKIRQDLFGCIDILAVGHGETVGIQSTSDGHNNVEARMLKIEDKPETIAALRDANWRIIIEGWKKPRHRWECREIDVS